MTRPTRALLLDLDDTLVDTRAALARAVGSALGEVLGPLAPGVAAEAGQLWISDREGWFVRYEAGELDYRSQREARFAGLARRFGFEASLFDEWEPHFEAALVASTTPFPDAAPLLTALDGVALAVVTNVFDSRFQRAKLDVAGLAPRLSIVVGVDVAGAPKPDPAPFRAACKLLGVAPHEAVHVGDSWTADVTGARNAGIRAVWLDRSGGGRDRELPPGVRRVGGLAEVLPLLDLPHPW